MSTALRDAWKAWRPARSILVLAAAALAVGIGATTAVFTVIDAVMLTPIEYAEGDRFGVLFGARLHAGPTDRSSLTFADAFRYQRDTRSFDVFGWFRPETYTITAPGPPRHVQGAAVTPSLAHHLGVQPIVGGWFTDEQEVVISSTLWHSLGGSRNLIGRPIVLNGRPMTIVGVMPPRFRLPEVGHSGNDVRNDVWIALDATGRTPGSRDGGFFFAYARLKPGVTFSQADADVKRVAAQIAKDDPLSHPGYTGRFDSLRGLIVEGVRPTLLVLLGGALLLVLIGCANVAALLLARAIARGRDTAVRLAIGATTRQLARQFFTESLIVGLIGGFAGVALSLALVRVTVAIAADLIPRADEVGIDWRVLVFTVAVSIAASVMSSLAPLWHARRIHPGESLTDGVRATSSGRSRKLSASLVVGELALAFTLLSLGTLLWLTVDRLLQTRPGFDAEHLLTFQITLPDAIGRDDQRRVLQQIRFVEAIGSLPGVSGIAISNQTPLDGCCLSTALYPDGEPADLSVGQKVSFLAINPGYFAAMRIPVRRGRAFTYADNSTDVLPVVVNEAAIKRYWPRREALGATGHISRPDGSPFRVLGVVGDVRNDGLDKPTVPEVYLLHSMAPVNPIHILVRSALPDTQLLPQIRRAVLKVDPTQPIHDEATMARVVLSSLSLPRVASAMTGLFAIAALIMAALGVYGMMAYTVRQRIVEFGTRMALGATATDVIRLVISEGLRIAVAGLALGGVVLLSAWSSSANVLQLPAVEGVPLLIAIITTFTLAATASLVPAWRASRLSPMVAMREAASPSSWRWFGRGLHRRLTATDDAAAVLDRDRPGPSPSLFVDAARTASSTQEALHQALAALVVKLDVDWTMLLESAEHVFRYQRAGRDGGSTQGEIPSSGFLMNRLQSHEGALPITSGDLEAWREWATVHRPEHADEIAALAAEGARLALALRSRGRVTAVLLLGTPSGGRTFSNAERQALGQAGHQLALMLENSKLTARILEQEALRRDLALAAEVQRRLLPDHPPRRSVASLAAFTIAARNVAGDYYDFLEVGDGRLGIALADVSGKGVAAALIMSVVQASLRIIASDEDVPLDRLAARMNQFLYRSTQSSSYATFFYAQLDERTKRMEYVNAGHNPPFLIRALRATGSAPEVIELSTGGMVLGLFPEVTFERASVQLHADDLVFIFSDGVPEALDTQGEELGADRLQRLLLEHSHLSVEEIASHVAAFVHEWSAGAPQHDDITFIVMKVRDAA